MYKRQVQGQYGQFNSAATIIGTLQYNTAVYEYQKDVGGFPASVLGTLSGVKMCIRDRCAVLPVYKLWALLVALGGAAVAFGVAKKTCPPRVVEHEVPFHTCLLYTSRCV